jgi:ABC-type antimicrobial peptide transport system permease subunit
MVLSALVLLAGEVVLAWGTWQVMRGRRGELATLRALGWQRRQLGWKLLAEFALAAVVAAAAATLAGYTVGALVGRREWAWLLLGSVAAGVVVLLGTWRPRRTAADGLLAEPRRGGLTSQLTARRPGRAAAPAGSVRSLLRSPSRSLLSTFVIAVADVALSLGLAARWAFSGAATPWTLRPLTWESAVVNATAVLLALLLATFTVADLNLATVREHAAELRTLRAIGWPARDLARLMLRNALLPGLAGGLAAGVFDLLAGLPVASSAPQRLIALVGLAAAAGVAMSLLAAWVPAVFGFSRKSREE